MSAHAMLELVRCSTVESTGRPDVLGARFECRAERHGGQRSGHERRAQPA
jgi:hypothetical protein